MKHSAILAAAMLAGSVGAAVAQQQPPVPAQGEVAPPPPSPEGMTPAPEGMAPPEGGSADMPMGHPPMGMRMGRGGPHHRAAGSFELRMGEGRSLRVRCGDEPIQACIDAAAPLIDRLSGMTPPPEGDPAAD